MDSLRVALLIFREVRARRSFSVVTAWVYPSLPLSVTLRTDDLSLFEWMICPEKTISHVRPPLSASNVLFRAPEREFHAALQLPFDAGALRIDVAILDIHHVDVERATIFRDIQT